MNGRSEGRPAGAHADQLVSQILRAAHGWAREAPEALRPYVRAVCIRLGEMIADQRNFFGWYREGEDLGILTSWRFAHTIEGLDHDPAKAAQSGPGQYWSRDSVLVNELGHVVRRSAWRTLNEKPIIYAACGNPITDDRPYNEYYLLRKNGWF